MRPPTLIDEIYKASFRNDLSTGWRSNAAVRTAIMSARRFVLDDSMSSFLGDLSTAAFKPQRSSIVADNRQAFNWRIIDQMRKSARLPFPTTWIEYNLQRSLARSAELLGKAGFVPEDVPDTEGLLLQRHPQIETACCVHIFTRAKRLKFGHDCWTFPVAYAWTVDDETVLPWPALTGLLPEGSSTASEIATGVTGYKTDAVNMIRSDLLQPVPTDSTLHQLFQRKKLIAELVGEWIGVLRRMLALLATLNDIPIAMHEPAVVGKGFIGRGQYRKYLDHKVVTLQVPQKTDLHKLARKIVAAARRRAHPVRGHWRKDWHFPPSSLCQHEWNDQNKCEHCHGRRMWIRDHERGNAAFGHVTHEYRVEHKEPIHEI